MKITKVTIGIPAYNEGGNIKKLVRSILDQKVNGFEIDKIVISSDGSTDNTVQKINTIKDKRVILINNKNRAGIARGLNQIIKAANSDILVTLDADIEIINRNFLRRLIRPILEQKADLTSSSIKETLPQSNIGNILNTSMHLKEVLFRVFKNGNNIYSCHGLARGYSRDFYKNLSFPVSIGNDMYTYLKCISKGNIFEYTPDARAYYHLPDNFKDHQKQSERFFISEMEMENIFGSDVVKNELHIPFHVYILALFKALPLILQNPFDSFFYFFIQLYLRLKPKNSVSKLQAWNIALSSKKM